MTPAIGKTAGMAFIVGAAEIAGMFTAIQVLTHRKQIAERMKFEINFWRNERKRALQETR